MSPKLMNAVELAAALGVSRITVMKWKKKKWVPVCIERGQRCFDEQDVRRALQRRGHPCVRVEIPPMPEEEGHAILPPDVSDDEVIEELKKSRKR